MTVLDIVHRERAKLRVVHFAAGIALVAAASVVIIGLGAWLLAGTRWITLPRGTPLLVWVVLLGANAAVIVWAIRRLRRDLAAPAVAAAIEREQTLRAGELRGVMEVSTESAIARRADQRLAQRLENVGPTLAPSLQRSSRMSALRAAGVAAVTLVLLLVAAPSLSDGLQAIRRPLAAWKGTLLPALGFRGLPPELLRGEPLTVTVDAPGRRTLQLSVRSTGEGWRTLTLAVDSARGVAVADVGQVRGDLQLVASDGRSETDTTVVRVTDRPFVGGVVLRAVYPEYLGRAPEGLPVGEPARVPRGTTVHVSGRASTTLRDVYIRGERDSVAFGVAGHSFTGRFTPLATARWEWFARDTRGPVADVPLPLEIEVMPDSVPRVELVSPATDTIIATTDRMPLAVTATDDYGFASIELHTTRQPAGRRKEAPAAQRIAGAQGAIWNGTPSVDLSTRGLEPGDALAITIVAVDNSPWAQSGVSRELVVRMPTMEERRSLAREAADSAANEAVSAAAAQKSLEQRTDEASRERSRSQSTGEKAAQSQSEREKEMSYAAAEKARALAKEQREMAERVEKLKEAAKQLEQQLKQASALDSSLARQLREAQDLLKDALTDDMLEQMKKLENATQNLSGDEARDALKDLAEQQKRLREQLEKSAEMLKRAALEGAMETLKDEAQDIADRQKSMADSGARMGKEERAKESDRLADRSERFSKDVEQLQDRLKKQQADAASERAASAQRNADAAEQQMRKDDAQGASEKMQQAAKDMEAARDQQVGEWKKELTDALDQSIQELLQMAREEQQLEEQARQSAQSGQNKDQMRGQQSAVKQGVDQTADRMQKEGQKSSLLSGRSQRAMAEAKQRVAQATQQLSEQQRGGQQAASSLGEAAEALNRAAASLARDREKANSAGSATGFSEMLQQLQEMAKRQGNINAQAQGLMPMPGQQSMSQDAQATARMLARQQRGIANQLEEMGDAAGGDRAAELAKEARQLAEVLEQTRVDAATVARQQQLFRRMLDAGRTLEKEEREEEAKREAKAATGDQRFDPGAAAVSGRAATKFREPAWNDLRGLTADERRAILEYFKRINAEKP
ncbi:MAG TPA: hypothetical protein VFO66_11780 [Gemmatimonadaceae bacterium]|nr:hypothetical protein [Gemmatimonadaceae bacterium]